MSPIKLLKILEKSWLKVHYPLDHCVYVEDGDKQKTVGDVIREVISKHKNTRLEVLFNKKEQLEKEAVDLFKIIKSLNPEYSKDIPTEPGYYWMKSTGMGTETIECVFRPFKDAAFLSIRVETNGHLPTKSVCRCSELDAWWAGPIQKPGE